MPDLVFHMTLAPRWEDIDHARVAVGKGVTALVRDRDCGEAAGMVAAELLENAFRHGLQEAHEVSIRCNANLEAIVVTVENPIPDEGAWHSLDTAISFLRGFPSARGAYLARMTQILEDDNPRQGSLGLLRVAFEACAQLHGELLESGAHVRVQARFSPKELLP